MPPKNENPAPPDAAQELEEARQEEQEFVDSITIGDKKESAPKATHEIKQGHPSPRGATRRS